MGRVTVGCPVGLGLVGFGLGRNAVNLLHLRVYEAMDPID